MQTFTQCERVFIDIIDYEQYKNSDGQKTVMQSQQFEFDIIKNIPKQIEKFFELQQFDIDATLDIPSPTGDSPRSTPKSTKSNENGNFMFNKLDETINGKSTESS